MDYLYKPGDTVRIRKDLSMGHFYCMKSGPYAGQERNYVIEVGN